MDPFWLGVLYTLAALGGAWLFGCLLAFGFVWMSIKFG